MADSDDLDIYDESVQRGMWYELHFGSHKED